MRERAGHGGGILGSRRGVTGEGTERGTHEGDGEARKMPRDPGEQVVAVTR